VHAEALLLTQILHWNATKNASIKRRIHEILKDPRFASFGFGLLVSVAVVAPLTKKGWLLLLDSVSGPHETLPRSLWGLDGGDTAAAPYIVLHLLLGDVFGHAAMTWIPFALFFPIAYLGMSALVAGSRVQRVAAGTAYSFTGIVFQRAWVGHQAYLLGYALLPLIAQGLIESIDESGLRRLRAVPWIALAVGMGVHYFWISLVIAIAVVVQRRFSLRSIVTVGITAIFVILSSFYLLSATQGGNDGGVTVGRADLKAYATVSDPKLGLMGNVAALYGYWRLEPKLPKNENPGWNIVVTTMIIVGTVGFWRSCRDSRRRPTVLTLLMAGIIGYFLSLGTSGPTGAAFLWMFNHVPGFAVMREPMKFDVLLALFYAAIFGYGVQELVERTQGLRSVKALFAVALVLLPIASTPTLLWGLWGRLQPSHIPTDWYAANSAMGSGPGKVLVLPWHEYLGFSFTDGRNVAQFANEVFDRQTIVGDNVELRGSNSTSNSPQSKYIEQLLEMAPDARDFGHLIAPTGTQYIFVEKVADASQYWWLKSQTDLKPVFETPTAALYENTAAIGAGRHMDRLIQVTSIRDLLSIPAPDLESAAVQLASGGATPTIKTLASSNDLIERKSPTSYILPDTDSGVDEIAEPFNDRWTTSGGTVDSLVSGTIGVLRTHSARTLNFSLWHFIVARYLLSAVTFLTVVGAQVYGNHTRAETA
jgi:hypothetical protein